MYSIAGCMGIHTYEALHHAGKHVEHVEVETDGVRQEQHPKVYTKISLKFRLKGAGLTDKDARDAIEEALHKTCSIAAMVNRVAPISYEFQLT
jgi:putative redox protein